MKKKVLLSSILTIALCMCLIAGSTYALFTSESKVNVAINSGEVDMVASIAITKLESVTPDANGEIEDEFGGKYSYVTVSPTFTNGGTAEPNGALIEMKDITPGDKVTVEISGTNNSTVSTLYRYVIDCESGHDLMKGLEFTVDGKKVSDYMATYTSPWYELESKTDMTKVPISIELPVYADNRFENTSTSVRIVVEAVQGNAAVDRSEDPTITYYNTASSAEELDKLLKDDFISRVDVTSDFEATITSDLTNKLINANGHNVALTFKGPNDEKPKSTLKNVVVANIVDTDGVSRSVDVGNAIGDITIIDSEIIDDNSNPKGAVYVGSECSVTIDNCNFTGIGKSYAIYSGNSASVKITNSTFTNLGSWAIMLNGTVNGDVIIDNCIFETTAKVGVLKTLGGGITGNFTFTNNTMNVPGEGGNLEKVVVSGSSNGPVVCAGDVVSENNKLNGDTWTVNVAG